MEVGVYGLLLKITFAMTRAIARTDGRKPIKAIADQALISIFLLALLDPQWSFSWLLSLCNGMCLLGILEPIVSNFLLLRFRSSYSTM